MELSLTDDDARILQDLLSDCLQELRREVARTEAKDYRHGLVLRQEVIERLLARLGQHIPAHG
jgi:hypothetical protein